MFISRSRSATATSRYKEGERNVFEHLSNLAKKNDKKVSTPTANSSMSELKPWIPNGKQRIDNTNKKRNDIITNKTKKSKDTKLMNDLYVYTTNSSSNPHKPISTPISNYRYNDEYSFTNFNEKSVKDSASEISISIQNTDSNRHKNLISQHSSSISPKKIVKEKSRVALSGYLIDKSSTVETCRQGILLVSRGTSSEELILSIRQQFGCNNISDVIVNFKNKVTQNVISRSYSMDKLEEMPQIDENCDFIAYIGGGAIIETNQSGDTESGSDYDYIGLRDRLAKKLHSFSVGSPAKVDKSDSLSVFSFDINQHSQNDDVVSNIQSSVSMMKSASQKSAPSISKEQSKFINMTSINHNPVISSSLKKKAKKLLSTSSASGNHQSKKALVQSLLSSDKPQETTSSLSNLFPYGPRENVVKSDSIDTVRATDNIIVKPKIKFQIDLSSLLEDLDIR